MCDSPSRCYARSSWVEQFASKTPSRYVEKGAAQSVRVHLQSLQRVRPLKDHVGQTFAGARNMFCPGATRPEVPDDAYGVTHMPDLVVQGQSADGGQGGIAANRAALAAQG